ncbi:MAG TPA: hypothetical protein VGL02_01240 [Streptomyces sp.]
MTGTDTAVDLRSDYTGRCELNLDRPTPEGRQHFTLHSGQIDGDAESYFGRGYCHWLAGAIHSITGWDLYTVDVREVGGTDWFPAHTGVLTPNGTVLDIFGEHTRQQVCDRYLTGMVSETRSRIVDSPNMPGDVISGVDDLRGDPHWWAARYTPTLQAVVLHFARLLLTRHDYGQHIADTAQPYPHEPVAEQRKSDTSAQPTGREPAMSSIPEEVARLNAIADAIPLGALEQLSESELPPEVLATRDAMSGMGEQVLSILGNTDGASQAAQLLGHAQAMLDRANETQQILKMQYGKALRSAIQAQQFILRSAQYHARGAGAS